MLEIKTWRGRHNEREKREEAAEPRGEEERAQRRGSADCADNDAHPVRRSSSPESTTSASHGYEGQQRRGGAGPWALPRVVQSVAAPRRRARPPFAPACPSRSPPSTLKMASLLPMPLLRTYCVHQAPATLPPPSRRCAVEPVEARPPSGTPPRFSPARFAPSNARGMQRNAQRDAGRRLGCLGGPRRAGRAVSRRRAELPPASCSASRVDHLASTTPPRVLSMVS